MEQRENNNSMKSAENAALKLSIDNPIKSAENDALNRHKSAKQFASSIFDIDASEGLVVGVLGEWGSGKTSYINMMREEILKHAEIIEFNPWMFSSVDNLVESFFSELTIQLRILNHHKISRKFKKYGGLFDKLDAIPFIGNLGKGISFFLNSVAFIWSVKEGGLSGLRNKLTQELKKLDKPIVVILDDVDRLSSQEIKEIFKLVRLTASFPNMIYLMAFDKLRVEQALSEQGQIDGKAYLEKILQLSFDIPKVSRNQIQEKLISALDNVLSALPIQFDEKRWGNILYEIILPNINNMRDVNRYALAVSIAFKEIKNKIEAVDILALEAIRLFRPDKFHQIYELRDLLTTVDLQTDTNTLRIKEFVEDDKQCNAIIKNIFPMSEQYLQGGARYSPEFYSKCKKEKRLVDSIFFDFYFEMQESINLSNYNQAQRILLTMADEIRFKNSLAEVPKENLEDIINNLISFEDEFTEQHALATIPYLYEIIKKIPDRPRTFMGISSKDIVRQLVFRLIRSIPEHNRLNIIKELMKKTNLSGRLEIINIVSYRETSAYKLLDENKVNILKEELYRDIQRASENELVNELELLLLLSWLRSKIPDIELPILKSKNIFFKLLNFAKSESLGRIAGSYYTYRKEYLFWEQLIQLYKSENNLHEMIDLLNSDDTFKNEPIMKLANKYRNGWRDDDYAYRASRYK
ncbi:KAP family P-loop NTPase fold protein [Neisseria zalophi]|uniref:KAP NTPase domain-containing protein n=1 Tax=Neisseria zalophi TaxID=640030 RepID=A0A5J6PWE1_9NEIS|nr:P-loop NTPase fold protein [Neisseria zalophi]QEY26596.1 hypothetical protein D0T92_08680 [Neisseria zalophi]